MASANSEKAQKLKRACDEAYAKYGSSCSHAVWSVISQYDPSQQYRQANQLIDYLETSPKWQPIAVNQLSGLASQGILVVGGLKKPSGNGHIVVVYPGPEMPNGGYYTTRSSGKIQKVSSTGSYATVMSTSMGHWPGAKSHGDKTAWDPWGNDADFKKVRFWKYLGVGDKEKPVGALAAGVKQQ